MSERGEAKARGRPREQGKAKERSSRLRARAAADIEAATTHYGIAEAARPRAIEDGRPHGASSLFDDSEAV